MELQLRKILPSLTLVAAWAYSLGWIKVSYYFRTFGIGLESIEFSIQDYLFASWYVLENVVFLLLLLWIAAIAQRKWVWGVVGVYLLLPFLTDWSYSHLNSHAWGWLLRWLVAVPHSILKFLPFLILGALLAAKEMRARFKQTSWPHGNFALIAVSIVAIAWSISAAKHFGSSEANDVLRNPPKYLLQAKLHISGPAPTLKPIETRQPLYLLYSSTHRCILLDTADFTFGQRGTHVKILYVPQEKVELIEGSREIQLDPGRLFW